MDKAGKAGHVLHGNHRAKVETVQRQTAGNTVQHIQLPHMPPRGTNRVLAVGGTGAVLIPVWIKAQSSDVSSGKIAVILIDVATLPLGHKQEAPAAIAEGLELAEGTSIDPMRLIWVIGRFRPVGIQVVILRSNIAFRGAFQCANHHHKPHWAKDVICQMLPVRCHMVGAPPETRPLKLCIGGQVYGYEGVACPAVDAGLAFQNHGGIPPARWKETSASHLTDSRSPPENPVVPPCSP